MNREILGTPSDAARAREYQFMDGDTNRYGVERKLRDDYWRGGIIQSQLNHIGYDLGIILADDNQNTKRMPDDWVAQLDALASELDALRAWQNAYLAGLRKLAEKQLEADQ